MGEISKKIYIILFIAFCFIFSAFVSRVFSYNDTITHPSLTENIVKVYNQNSEKKLSELEINWLKQGSVEEDATPRWLNHFYEPNIGVGLGTSPSAKNWAQSPSLQAVYLDALGFMGDQTWQKAIESYAKGDNKAAFVALGHVLHLIEDMSVPAHTRLDQHLGGDFYEIWTRDKIGSNIKFNISPIDFDSLSDFFYNIAYYSNKYFLSEDTVNVSFLNGKGTFSKKINGAIINCIEGIDFVNSKFCLIVYKTSKFGRVNYYIDDPTVHADYFNLLGPKAVAYGAGVVKLFFEEAEKKKQEEEAKSWWQKTKSFFNKIKGNVFGSVLGVLTDEANNDQIFPTEVGTPDAKNRETGIINGENGNQNNGNADIQVEYSQPTEPPANNLDSQSNQNNQQNNSQGSNEGGNDSNGEKNSNSGNDDNANNNLGQNAENNIGSENENSEGDNDAANVGGSGSSGQSPELNPGWNSDTTPPQTTATSTLFTNNSTTATTTAVFEFSSSEANSTFGCSLDNAAFNVCSSPKEYNNLAGGSHNFQVKAIDASGNQDSTPEIFNWTIDASAPSISGISASGITRTSAIINFTTNEPAYAKITYGTTTLYGFETIWESATSTSHAINLTGLEAGKTYHFKISAKDETGNEVLSADNNLETSSVADHIIISEIQTSGANGADDEWVELYNPTIQDIDLSGWSVQYRGSASQTFNKKNFVAGNVIPARGYFLIAGNAYQGGVSADMSHNSFSLSATGGNVFLVANTSLITSATSTTIIDKLAYGAGTYLFPETAVFANAPASGQTLERKANASSTAASLSSGNDKWQGNGYDLNDNSNDFVLQTSPTPQNSASLTEPRSSFPSQSLSLTWPMFQGSAGHQAYSASGPIASTTTLLFSGAGITFRASPTIAGDKIFVGAEDGLRAFDLSGNQLWHFKTGIIWGAPAINSDGVVFARADEGIYAVYADGTLKWQYLMSGNYQTSSLNINENGVVYTISSGRLYAFEPDGRIKWIFDISQPPLNRSIAGLRIGSPAIDNNQDRIYINIENYIYALDFNGNLVWDFQNDPAFSSPATSFASPAVGGDGTIYTAMYVGGANGGFYALNPDKTTKWFSSVGYSARVELSPAIGQNGKVYFTATKFSGGAITKLFAFNATSGANDWNVLTSDGNSYSPLIAGGNIYLADGFFVDAYNSSGNLLWQTQSSGSYIGTGLGAVDSAGNLYFAVNNKIYKIGN
jgi:hypothetical protein